MTLKKIGTVTITEDKMLVEHFHFVDHDGVGSAAIEALTWAQGRVAEGIAEEKRDMRDRELVEEVSMEVYGWIDDLKAKYPNVDPEHVRQVYGDQLSSNETAIDPSAVEDVFIGIALGVYEPESLG